LYFLQKPIKAWQKALFIAAVLSIYGSMAITFHRGTLFTVLVITLYFILSSGKVLKIVGSMAGIFVLVGVGYLLFGSTLASKGYDPIAKIMETAAFTADVSNPEWDKGRSISQGYAIAAWKKNFWLGAGYDELLHYGLPQEIATAHNGFITSLFHRGVLGTTLLILIFVILFKTAVGLWRICKRGGTEDDDMAKLLVMSAFFWIIPFLTQEALWEKYSMSVQYVYLGLITNLYKQKKAYRSGLAPVPPKNVEPLHPKPKLQPHAV
jgi:O-antigen ligase